MDREKYIAECKEKIAPVLQNALFVQTLCDAKQATLMDLAEAIEKLTACDTADMAIGGLSLSKEAPLFHKLLPALANRFGANPDWILEFDLHFDTNKPGWKVYLYYHSHVTSCSGIEGYVTQDLLLEALQ